jgi:hypothetical protein
MNIDRKNFIYDIKRFRETRMHDIVNEHITDFMKRFAKLVSGKIIDIIFESFDSWQEGQYSTIAQMNEDIQARTSSYMRHDLKSLVQEQVLLWLSEVGGILSREVMDIESHYNLPFGTLAVSLKSISSVPIEEDLGIAAILEPEASSDLLSMIASNNIIMSITLKASFTVLAMTNPFGWVLLATAGIFSLAAGADKLAEKLIRVNIPKWFRNSVKKDSIRSNIEMQRLEIENKLFGTLMENTGFHSNIANLSENIFEKALLVEVKRITPILRDPGRHQ